MKKITPIGLFYLLLGIWFLVNLIQAIFTEITSDEAYYWLWGQNLSFGYFDHPPMVAVMTNLSSHIFSGNLGVRFLTVLLQPLTIMLLSNLAGVKFNSLKSVLTFWLITASLFMFNAYGFITTPDVPLLFFAALFLFEYKQFLKNQSFTVTFLLSFSMAGMIYSKYHGGLLILLVVLSNLKLLKNYRFWISGLLALLMLLPHIFWQIQNHFPGFGYHLKDRVTGFNFIHLLEYWPNQLVVFNPFTFVAVVWMLFSRKKTDQFENALRFILVGFILFFWIMSIRGHAEPHWTVVASIPMIILLFRESEVNVKLAVYLKKFVLPSLLLVLSARILIITDVLPERLGFNGKASRYEAFEKIAGDAPVVFTGSFQAPSLYSFFTGREAHVVSSTESRRTQFDLWNIDEKIHGKTVFIPAEFPGKSKKYEVDGVNFNGFFTDSLQITNHIEIIINLKNNVLFSGKIQPVNLIIKNKSIHPFDFNHSVFPVKIIPVLVDKDGIRTELSFSQFQDAVFIPANQQKALRLNCKIPDQLSGNQSFAVLLGSFFGHTLNSELIPVTVKP